MSLQSKLGAIKELKSQYHIGSKAALYLLKMKQRNTNFKTLFSRQGDEILRYGANFERYSTFSVVNEVLDNLYLRLKREQTLQRDDLQKLYLARLIEYKNHITPSDLDNQIQNLQKRLNGNFGKEFQEVVSQEELDWLRIVSRRHRNWLIKYLQS